MKMISIKYLILIASCIAYSSGEEQQPEVTTTPKADDASGDASEIGYISYSNPIFLYPSPSEIESRLSAQRNPTETNEIEGSSEVRNRPLFIFTTYRNPGPSPQRLSDAPYIEIRKKREAIEEEVPEASKGALLRRKRTYCRKCGGGGYGGYGGYTAYVPVTYVAYPVYYGGYGGGNKGCNTCGVPQYSGGGGGGGGSFSYSTSSAHSSSGSFGWGK